MVATIFSLMYVHQQAEIFRLGYEGQSRHTIFQNLLDKNTVLRYNIEKNSSLTRIATTVTGDDNFQMPDSYKIVRLNYPVQNYRQAVVAQQENLFARLFGIKRQAEAKTINP